MSLFFSKDNKSLALFPLAPSTLLNHSLINSPETLTAKDSLPPQGENECLKHQQHYSQLLQKGSLQTSLRFENIHKKIGADIYRLRFFFKDGDEGERQSFLVYLEDQQANANIIEKSTYQKGKLFLKIEKAQGEILYREKGFTHDSENKNLFLQTINDQLVKISGPGIDCQF